MSIQRCCFHLCVCLCLYWRWISISPLKYAAHFILCVCVVFDMCKLSSTFASAFIFAKFWQNIGSTAAVLKSTHISRQTFIILGEKKIKFWKNTLAIFFAIHIFCFSIGIANATPADMHICLVLPQIRSLLCACGYFRYSMLTIGSYWHFSAISSHMNTILPSLLWKSIQKYSKFSTVCGFVCVGYYIDDVVNYLLGISSWWLLLYILLCVISNSVVNLKIIFLLQYVNVLQCPGSQFTKNISNRILKEISQQIALAYLNYIGHEHYLQIYKKNIYNI